MTQEWWAGLVVMLRQWAKKIEAHFTGPPNHTTHINKVWDPFCKRKWFGISKWVWEHSWMPMFMSEDHIGDDVSTARLNFQPNNQIWCRDVQLRYFPSADPRLSVAVHVYISSNTRWTAHWASCSVVISVQVVLQVLPILEGEILQGRYTRILLTWGTKTGHTSKWRCKDDAQACLNLSEKAEKDVKFKIVEIAGKKVMIQQESSVQRKTLRIQSGALRDPSAVQWTVHIAW